MVDRKCTRCRVVKPLAEFYRHPRGRDGHDTRCTECAKTYMRRHRKNNIVELREREARAAQTPAAKARAADNQRAWAQANPDGIKAQRAVRRAVKAGRIKAAPDGCEECGREVRLHAHHEDYDRQLAVEWLCPRCHYQRTRSAA